jgi:ABC-2 type transport system permease protein
VRGSTARTPIHRSPYCAGVSIWRSRQALFLLVRRDLSQKYRKLRLGYLWAILEPLGMSVTMWFVFEILLGGRKMGGQPYYLFLTVAILPWWWFTSGISSATKAFIGFSRTLPVSVLPTQFSVVRVLITRTFDFLFSLPLILFAMLVTWSFPGINIGFFFLAFVVQLILMYGLSLLVASISVLVPDFARIVRIVLRAAFYLSPVLYSLALVPESARSAAAINPLAGILALYRVGWWPEEHVPMFGYAISGSVALICVIAGIITFLRLEHRILKEA